MNSQYIISALKDRLEDLVGRELEKLEIAVLDSGVDASHPELADHISACYAIETKDDKPVVVETHAGENNDLFGHGTGVASIITRIAPNAKIVDIRVLGSDNRGSGAALVEGLRLAISRKSRLVNMSLASSSAFAQTLFSLCERAYYQNQIIVAAKKNMPLADMGFPAEFSNCISVDNTEYPWPFVYSYQPDQLIEFAADGEQVVCAAAGGGYTAMTGTSFATPTICGICALILGAYPALRPFELKTILKAHSKIQE